MIKISEAIIKVLFLLILVMFFAGSASAGEWEQTTPSLTDLTGIWTTYSTTNKIFCTGKSGTIVHHDGTDWESMDSGAAVDLNAIWGTSIDDIFAVGDSATILHYDGDLWSSQLSVGNDLNAVWGTSASNVYAVGNGGIILHYNGTVWSAMDNGTIDNPNLNGIWGSSTSDVFAVGDNFTILHYDGSAWSPILVTSATNVTLNAIWGYAADSVFAVGEAGTIAWYNGNVWNLVSSEISSTINLNAVWGASACNVYAVGRVSGYGSIYHFNGSVWTSDTSTINPPNPVPLFAIYGNSMRDIFVVGNVGTYLKYAPVGDEVYPEICATSPVDEALEISPDSSIYALFSTEMDPDTITTATFTLTTGNNTISGTVSYEAGGFAVFTPDDDLSYATSYTATISTDVEDPFGYALASEYTWDFTTTTLLLDSDSKGCFISSARVE